MFKRGNTGFLSMSLDEIIDHKENKGCLSNSVKPSSTALSPAAEPEPVPMDEDVIATTSAPTSNRTVITTVRIPTENPFQKQSNRNSRGRRGFRGFRRQNFGRKPRDYSKCYEENDEGHCSCSSCTESATTAPQAVCSNGCCAPKPMSACGGHHHSAHHHVAAVHYGGCSDRTGSHYCRCATVRSVVQSRPACSCYARVTPMTSCSCHLSASSRGGFRGNHFHDHNSAPTPIWGRGRGFGQHFCQSVRRGRRGGDVRGRFHL